MLYLNVPKDDENEVKNLGAEWDAEKQRWYVPHRDEYEYFMKWLHKDNEIWGDTMIAVDKIYLVIGEYLCENCGDLTPIVAIGYKKHFNIEAPEEQEDIDGTIFTPEEGYSDFDQGLGDDIIHISYFTDTVDFNKKFWDMLAEKYNFKNMQNFCIHCNAEQEYEEVYNEVDSPFVFITPEKAKNLVLYEIKLDYDIVIPATESSDSNDDLIEELATIIPLKLDYDIV